ncbi:MAG: gamma-glutamyl-gamma-aminobutyrate hydrolase family protein [Ardenticatenaceae bacterium]|nr:gamma-glutamyl-gamma-aminobutyrate hydrolase family protein [Ardenticatenaceae bacterium]
MIVYVDIEHDRVKEMGDKWDVHLQRVLNVKYRLEEISGDHCLVMRYKRVNPEVLRELKVRAVLVSGNITEFQHYDEADLAGLRAMFREGAQPTLGFCGGCQMMAQTFGVNVGAIIPAEAGDMNDESWRNRTHEWGFTPVQQLRPHPLFAGLAPQMNLFEAHYWEVKQLPEGFENLAATDITALQLLAHQSLPLFGTQFHPEAYDEKNLDGRRFLQNFFALVAEREG